jgi:hypothetical protein
VYFAQKIVERVYGCENVESGREMRCYAKNFSWAIDEGVQIAV